MLGAESQLFVSWNIKGEFELIYVTGRTYGFLPAKHDVARRVRELIHEANAIVETQDPVTFNLHVQPIRLPSDALGLINDNTMVHIYLSYGHYSLVIENTETIEP